MRQAAGLQAERLFQSRQHFCAARVTDKFVDILEREIIFRQKFFSCRAHFRAHQVGNIARKQHAKAVILDAPAHNFEGIGPGVLAPGRKFRPLHLSVHDRGRGAVSEQCRGDHIALAAVVEAEGQSAQLNHGEDDIGTRHGARQGARPGQADHAAGAAEAEYRQALHVTPHLETFDQQRIQAGRGNARGRGNHQGVDVLDGEAGALEAAKDRLLKQIYGVLYEQRIALGEAVLFQIPFDGNAGMARADSGILEYRNQTLKIVKRALKQLRRAAHDIFLVQHMVGNGRCQPAKACVRYCCGRYHSHVPARRAVCALCSLYHL